jgi:hypothetical protein
MADKEAERKQFIEDYRKTLNEFDEVGQIVLKGHLEIEAVLNDILATVFQRENYFRKSRLSFMQKTKLVRAMSEHEDEDFGWPLVDAFNALRNDIAHKGKSEHRSQKIKELKGHLKRFGDEEFVKKAESVGEEELVVMAAAMSNGFVLTILNEELGGASGVWHEGQSEARKAVLKAGGVKND